MHTERQNNLEPKFKTLLELDSTRYVLPEGVCIYHYPLQGRFVDETAPAMAGASRHALRTYQRDT